MYKYKSVLPTVLVLWKTNFSELIKPYSKSTVIVSKSIPINFFISLKIFMYYSSCLPLISP